MNLPRALVADFGNALLPGSDCSTSVTRDRWWCSNIHVVHTVLQLRVFLLFSFFFLWWWGFDEWLQNCEKIGSREWSPWMALQAGFAIIITIKPTNGFKWRQSLHATLSLTNDFFLTEYHAENHGNKASALELCPGHTTPAKQSSNWLTTSGNKDSLPRWNHLFVRRPLSNPVRCSRVYRYMARSWLALRAQHCCCCGCCYCYC